MEPALVCLHGFTHTGASWDPVVRLLDRRYRVWAPDIRGHGAAWPRTPVSLDAVVGDLAALAPSRFALCGYSMGGRLALHAALALADRVSRLVLVGASPGLADPAERAVRRWADEELAERIEPLTIEEFAALWAETPVLAGLPEPVAAAVHADRLRNTSPGLAAALRGLGAGALPSLWHRLGELTMPVSLVVGERDAKFTEIARRMAAALPRAELTIVPGAGHAVHLEAPDQVAAILAGGHRRLSSTPW
jgi:2-succinyl-6-hydroxy-2,4-cyclohexadiene-1-carboxylate synthase